MCSDLGEGSRCCAGYSFVGALFTLWVGVMISTQPFFIAGVEDPDVAKSSAFGACGIFAFTFVSSILGIWYDTQNKSAANSLTMEDGGDSMAGSSYQLARDNNFPSYGATPVMT